MNKIEKECTNPVCGFTTEGIFVDTSDWRRCPKCGRKLKSFKENFFKENESHPVPEDMETIGVF